MMKALKSPLLKDLLIAFTEQITAQENKKADLEAKRAKEKEEVTLSEQDIVDAYMLNVTRNVNNHTAGRSNPRFGSSP